VLTLQFRSAEELDQIQRSIRAGEPIAFSDDELKLAATIGSWNAAVTLSFLAAAVLTGLFIGAIVARVSLRAIGVVGAAAVLAFALAFGLMRHVDGKVRALAGPNASS
jgi:ABC-type transporter Mla maintaining outer membrane lipid asymmetry permease subunit MlaE